MKVGRGPKTSHSVIGTKLWKLGDDIPVTEAERLIWEARRFRRGRVIRATIGDIAVKAIYPVFVVGGTVLATVTIMGLLGFHR